MAALNRLCQGPDDFAGASTAGATLPFLPTLVVAALLGVGALCWDRAEPAPAPAGPAVEASAPAKPLPRVARTSIDSSDLAQSGGLQRLPAALAFASVFPVTLEAPAVAVARAEGRPALRIALPHAGCAGRRCREDVAQTSTVPPRRPQATVAATVPAEARPLASARSDDDAMEGSLSERALPFAPVLEPAVRAFQRTVGLVGSQAAAVGTDAIALGTDAVALCDAVTGLVGGLR